MHNTLSRLLAAMVLSVLAIGILPASAQRLVTLETKNFRLMHEKKHAALAGEILEIAEKVWPTLAKAYESYEHYERIDILIIDQSDDANGFAIYPWSQVAIFAPHMDWVLRNRQVWLRNVVTHELAHVFSLRRAARLAPFDYVLLNGSTYNARAGINFNFSVPWVPLIAPNWWIEGIAQFEAEQNGNDTYDSQRDMLLRDAWLTGTMPTLDFIETFDRSEDWTQGERVYNTGYAFLRFLKDRYGVDKVRQLAFHKPLFNFSSSAKMAFGQSLPDLFEAFKKSLAERYESFKDLPVDPLADPAMPGSFQQNLVFSSDGKYQAWLGNDDTRRAPLNWIYWKPLAKGGDVKKSDAPATVPALSAPPAAPAPAPAPEPTGEPKPGPQPEGIFAAPGPQAPVFNGMGGIGGMGAFRAPNPTLAMGMRNLAQVKGPGRGPLSQARVVKRAHQEVDRSEELGSEGLEFNRENNRLLTSRQDWEYSAYTDIWEYEFKGDKDEEDKWHRLTWEERASYPSYHPTERKILFVRKKAGTTNLAVLDSAGRIGQLTNFSQGQQVYNPRYTPKGDSIYFTLQVEDKEAIAAIPADVPAFDPFLAIKDTAAAFPDSLNLARDRKLTMVTPLRVGAIRNIRFQGDTLLWSSNMEDTARPVYNVYVRLPGDPQVMRATQVRTQALEPFLHEGTLYYQGFQRQRFLTFKRPLVLTPTGATLATTVDSISLAKPKKVDFTKAFEAGEYGSPRIAHEIVPYFTLQPQFLEGERTYTDMALGMQLHVGDPLGNWSQSFSADVSKRLDWKTPLNYQFTYSGFISGPAIRHTRITWPLNLLYSIRHDIVQLEDVDSVQFPSGPATIDIKAYYSTLFTRDFANFYFPLPYEFHLDGGFFRQLVSQNVTQVAVINDGSTGEITTQRIDNLRVFDRAQQHRHFQTGVNWSHTWAMLGTYRPTYANVWTSARKWWATYMTDVIPADSALIRAMSQEGRPAPEAIFTQSQFDPWNLDAGLNLAWSHKQALTFFAAAQGGAFLNKFPTETVPGDLAGPDATKQEPFGTLWVLNYQLGYYLMPGYPYNFRYRGRDIMEGTSLGLLTAGFDIPVRGLGAFIPGPPISSFREFSLRGWANAGTTLIVPFDKIPSFVADGRHDLLVDLNVRAAANFRIYHQYPFTIYAQGSMPYNKLDEKKLFWYDYSHTGAPNDDGSPSVAQIANASADRKRHMDLVKVPRYFVGFTLGY